jgi:hypothetical protein
VNTLFLLRQLQRDAIKIDAFLDKNPVFLFKMNPAQTKCYAEEEIVYTTLLLWGNRTGKSTLGVLEVIAHAHGYRPWLPPTHRHFWVRNAQGEITKPPVKVRILAMEWDEHVGRVLWGLFKKWIPTIELNPSYHTKKHQTGAVGWIEFPNGSTVSFITDLMAKSAAGSDLDFIWQDELVQKEVFTESCRGLIDRGGTVLITLTPYAKAGDIRRNQQYLSWIFEDIYKRSILEKNEKRKILHRTFTATSRDNIGFGITRKGLDTFTENLTDEERLCRVEGKFMFLTGTIYRLEQKHKRTLKRDENFPVSIGIDPHPNKPHYALFVMSFPEDKDDRLRQDHLHAYAFVIERDIIAFARMLAEIEPRLTDFNLSAACQIIVDPTFAYRKDVGTGKDFVDYLREEGIRCAIVKAEHSQGSVERGILDTQKRLIEGRLTFDPSLQPLFDECDRYIRDMRGNPIKADIDLLDCLRAVVQADPIFQIQDTKQEERDLRNAAQMADFAEDNFL